MRFQKSLEQALRTGKIIPFVGAGVSMEVKDRETGNSLFPSWRQLLELAAQQLDDEHKENYATLVRALLGVDKPNYLMAAQQAQNELGRIWFELLKESFDPPRDRVDDDSLSLAKAIWNLGSRLIITTNYDRVLSWACPEPGNLRPWNIEAVVEQATDLRHGTHRPTVWHLHGSIDDAAKIILTAADYRLLYSEAGDNQSRYEAALKTLQAKLVSYSFLFIGFSFDDSYVRSQLKDISRIYKGMTGPHYVLAREQDRTHLASLDPSLQFVPFTDFGEPLLQVVRELGEIARPEERPEEPTDIEQIKIATTNVADYSPHHSVFFVPFRQKGDQVIGRERVLQDVRTQLTDGRPTAIGQTASFQGLGGLGKTQLAVEYAYRFKDEYPNGVIWLNADQDIDAQLTELAEKARWAAPESEHKFKLEIALHRLRTYSDCLIIFDNLEAINAIQNYLPEHDASPHLLVTSRSEQLGFSPIDIDLLDKTLSLELLYQEAKRKPSGIEEERATEEIAAILGGLPLALELAGAYLHHRQVSWQQYLDLLNQNPRTALLNKYPSFTKHEADIFSTLKINEEIFAEEPKLRDVLDLLTWSGSAPMGLSLMSSLLNIQNPTELTNALGLGLQLHLLQRTSDSAGYLIHRLVSRVRREEIPLEERSDWVNDICERLGDWFQELKENFTDLPRVEAEIHHLRVWQEHASAQTSIHSSRLLWLQAYPPYHRGQFKEVQKLVQKALELFEQKQIDNDDLKAHLFNDLGFCFITSGNTEAGLEFREKSLDIRLQIYGEQHRDTAASFAYVGSAYSRIGNFKKALEYTNKALTILLELVGTYHPQTTAVLSSIGSVYSELGDYKKALEYKEKSLSLSLQLFGELHPDTGTAMGSVGSVYNRLGDYKKALEYEEKSLDIYLQLFGEQHRDTAASFSNIAIVYLELGDYKKALEYIEKGLAILLELLGEQHPDTAASMGNAGGVYSRLGDYKKALEYKEKSLSLSLQLFGEHNINTAMAMSNVGATYYDVGNYKKAIEYEEKALDIYTDLMGTLHPIAIKIATNLARALVKCKNPLKAYHLLDKIMKQLPLNHFMYGDLKNNHTFVRDHVPGLRHSGQRSKKRRRH